MINSSGAVCQTLRGTIGSHSPYREDDLSPSCTQNQQRILIVDDEQSLRTLFKIALTHDRRTVDCCCDGIEALRAIEESHFDLILLDMRMPRLDGAGFLKELRSRGDFTKVVVCSAELEPSLVARSIAQGVVTFLPKPLSLEAIRNAVELHLTPPEPTEISCALSLAERMQFKCAARRIEDSSTSCGPEGAFWCQAFKKLSKNGPAESILTEVKELIQTGALCNYNY